MTGNNSKLHFFVLDVDIFSIYGSGRYEQVLLNVLNTLVTETDFHFDFAQDRPHLFIYLF